MNSSKKLKAILAVGLPALLVLGAILAGLLAAGGLVHNVAADSNTNAMMSHNGGSMSMMEGGTYLFLKGQISNVQLDSSNMPSWVQSGVWVLRAHINSTSIDSSQFYARFEMIKPDGTAMHQHLIYGFVPTQFSMEQNGTVAVLAGTATITMPSGPVEGVALTIKVINKALIALWIGPDKVSGHFGTGPIYGTLSTPSIGLLREFSESMMSGSKMSNAGMMEMHQNLTKTLIPAVLPLTHGYVKGHDVFYISTEASDKGLASLLTNRTGFRVTYAPALSSTPPSSLANIYAFKNGIQGSGPLGFQPNVADSQPGDPQYSPLWRIILVQWNQGITPTELKSEQDISAAVAAGQVTIQPTSMIVNCPFVKWEGGSLMERADKNLTDTSPYGPGQILDINTDKLQATFAAHRGFAPDGSTIYYIATDASNPDVANALGVTFVNKTGATTLSSASSDLYVFSNGIKGTGPMGYQASIAGSNAGTDQYSPMWRINVVTWKDPTHASFLTTTSELGMAASSGMLSTQIAGLVVNCPIIQVG